MKHFVPLSAASVALLLTSVAQATPPATALERTTTFHHEVAPHLPPPHIWLTAAEAITQIGKIASWDVTMQSTACAQPDAGADAGFDACTAGGIIEVQSGPGMEIIASDNTQETIGIWNINDTLNGVARPSNIAAAFGFLETHPGYLAWQVAGDPGPDYYSVYNCGWGVRAVMLYEAKTGDMSHHTYGETCAQHIAANAGNLIKANATLLDVGPAGWAASGLWLWGNTYTEDAAMKATAATIGGQVKGWLEAFPSRISESEWSMTGGAPYYGVVESYMKENPTELVPWVTQYGPMLGGWIDESTAVTPNDWTDWRNAWNNWNMLAQFTSANVLGETAGTDHAATATSILSQLVAQANATTGAISGSEQRPSTEAESWITAYLVYFGLLQVIDHTIPVGDGGVADAGAADSGVELRDAGKSGGSKDAGGSRDAGQKSGADAGGSSTGDSASSGGCSVSSPGNPGSTGLLPLVLVPLFLAARRKRSARREPSGR